MIRSRFYPLTLGPALASLTLAFTTAVLPIAHAGERARAKCDAALASELSKYRRETQLKLLPIDGLEDDWIGLPGRLPRKSHDGLEDVELSLPGTGTDLHTIAEILARGQGLESDVQSMEAQLRLTAENSRSKIIPLTPFMPKFVQERNLTWVNDGPEENANCWNATLNYFEPETGVRQTSEEQMTAALTEKFTELLPGQDLQFGDVVSFWDVNPAAFSGQGYVQLLHTAIYLSDKVLWHKESTYSADPYTYELFERTFQSYYLPFRKRLVLKMYRYKREK